jgi:hypothetical protein
VNASAAVALVFVTLLLAGLMVSIVLILRRARRRPRVARPLVARKLKRRALLMMMPSYVFVGSAAIVLFTGHPTIALVIFVGYVFLVMIFTVMTGIYAGRRSRT